MTPANRHILIGTLVSISLVSLLTIESRPVAHAAEGDEVEYTFDRPITEGEQTYAWYRKTHGDEAAKRYGVNPDAVGDGMDTWHWWTGVDNRWFWRDLSVLTSGKGSNPVDARVDFLSVVMQPRADRWKKMGLINDPDRRSREARQIWPDDRSYEGRLPHLGPRSVRLFQRGHRTAALPQQEVRRQQMVSEKVHGRRRFGRTALSGRHGVFVMPCQLQSIQTATRPSQSEMGEHNFECRQQLFPRRHAVRPCFADKYLCLSISVHPGTRHERNVTLPQRLHR